MPVLTQFESQVNAFYLTFYGRPGDPAGVKYWAQRLEQAGDGRAAVLQAFATSPEATARFGSDTIEQRVVKIYQQLFDRAPDAEGAAYWAGVVASGHASLMDVAMAINDGAQGSDLSLSMLRWQTANAFTVAVEEQGSKYEGYAAIEAARMLTQSVGMGVPQVEWFRLIDTVVDFADTASRNPHVIEAMAGGKALVDLLDTARGRAEPLGLIQGLSSIAKAALADPVSLNLLLRGAGMEQVLKAIPAHIPLGLISFEVDRDGLSAAIELVYPNPPVLPPWVDAKLSAVASMDGLLVETNVAGELRLVQDGSAGHAVSLADGTTQAVAGKMLIGAQQTVVSGQLQVVKPDGMYVTTPIPTTYTLGTNRGDQLTGTELWGFDGDDRLTGTDGADLIYDGDGNDIVIAGGGRDTIFGGTGSDWIDLGRDTVSDWIYYQFNSASGPDFVDGASTANIDKIVNFGVGDLIYTYSPFDSFITGKSTYLHYGDIDDYAIVRGSDEGGVFIAGSGAADDDYLVQWDGDGAVDSAILHDFGTTAPSFAVSGNKMTLEAPAMWELVVGVPLLFG